MRGNIPTITNKQVRIHKLPLRVKFSRFRLFGARVMTCCMRYYPSLTCKSPPSLPEVLSRYWTNDHKETYNFEPRRHPYHKNLQCQSVAITTNARSHLTVAVSVNKRAASKTMASHHEDRRRSACNKLSGLFQTSCYCRARLA